MSRTPSMTPAEAESLLGPRGHLHVNSDNRATVRKWVVANGFPSAFVAGLSMVELAMAYNKLDGEGLKHIKRKLDEAGLDDTDLEPQAPVAPMPAAPNPIAANVEGDRTLAMLRELLLNGYKPGLDENRVRALIDEQVAGIAPRVIEVRHDGGARIKIEGLVHPDFELILQTLQQIQTSGQSMGVMLVGPAGCGKSHMCAQLAKALNVEFGVISGSSGASESELNGWLLPGDGGRFEYSPSNFVRLFERGSAAFCFDEIDGFDPNMLMKVNVPLANGHFYVQQRRDNPAVVRGPNFHFMATANTFGTGANPLYVGRNPMDEATRDRFVFFSVDYDKRLEEQIAATGGLTAAEMAGIWELRDRCREAQLRRVISTRAFQKAAVLKAVGQSWRQIRDRLLEGWSKDERAKVGV